MIRPILSQLTLPKLRSRLWESCKQSASGRRSNPAGAQDRHRRHRGAAACALSGRRLPSVAPASEHIADRSTVDRRPRERRYRKWHRLYCLCTVAAQLGRSRLRRSVTITKGLLCFVLRGARVNTAGVGFPTRVIADRAHEQRGDAVLSSAGLTEERRTRKK